MRIPKGIKVKDVEIGTGALAAKGVIVLVHYDCFLPRGEKIDTSRERGFPAQFRLGQREIFPGLEYGVPGMRVGGLRSIRVNPNLAYYERKTHPSLPANVALRYEVELIRVSENWDNSIYAPIAPWLGQ